NLVEACKAGGAKLVFISSDLVFDGKKGSYSEEDEVNPLIVYGKQKVMAEKIIREGLDSWLILRASSVYGWTSKGDNFVLWALQELKRGQELDIVYDQYVTPLYVGNLANMLIELLERNKCGLYHVGEEECLTKYEFVVRIAEMFGLDRKLVKPVPSDKLGQNIKMPKNKCLDLTKIGSELDLSRYSLSAGLEAMKKETLSAWGGLTW
ncbi:MAG: SDR family oxidoreductase, partial [Methermicoccaceae archaeon]